MSTPDVSAIPGLEFMTVANGDIELRVAVGGSGPLMLFVHGWPELWYSWRHQLRHLAERGYAVAAMDVRGYGGSSKPPDIASYRMTEMTSDVAAVIDALGGTAVVVGHDWGAPIAWNTARLHASAVRAVVGLSVPYAPIGPVSSLELWRSVYAGKFFYQLYIEQPGVAEAEMDADIPSALRKVYHSISGAGAGSFVADKPADAGLLDGLIDPDPFPDWMTADDLQVYVDAFTDGGWHGPFHRYRAQTLDSADLGGMTDPSPTLAQPAAFIGGEFDAVRRFVPGLDLYEYAGNHCADFRGTTIVPGVGHWVQQEAPDAVNTAIDEFLAQI